MPHKEGFEGIINKKYGKDRIIHGIEIGLWHGNFSAHMMEKFPNLYLTSIDPYVQWHEVLENNKRFFNRFQVLPVASDCAVKLLDKKYDFIFIDGDHSYEQCRKDIVNYLGFLKPGGIFGGHNYHKAENSAHPGVHESVDEIFGDKVKLAKDFIWYVEI
jgi:predicted O-methyltransferase YrrM